MSRKKTALLLIGILIIATFFRLYHFTSVPPGLYPDEAINGNDAAQALQTANYKVFYPENNGREGLFINIQAVFIKIFGNQKPWVLRLPSAVFGILTVLGLYFLGKELYSKKIGLLAAFFLSVSFWHVNFSRIGFRAVLAPMLAVWAFYFLMLAFRDPNAPRLPAQAGKKMFWLAALAGAVFGLGVYTYIAFRILPILAVILLFFYWLRSGRISKNEWLGFGAFVLASIVVALPILIYFLHNPADFLGRTSEISVFSGGNPAKTLAVNTLKTLGMFFFAGDGNWRHNLSGAPELFWPVAVFFLIGVIYALKKFRGEKTQSGFIFSWFILALAPVVFSSEGVPHALRSLLLIPPVFLLAGVGAATAYNLFRYRLGKTTLNIISALVLIFIAFYGYKEYFWDWANNPNVAEAFNENYVKIGEDLNSLPKEMPKYVVVEAGGVLVNGIPMPAQTVMFITDTFTPEKQKDKNIHYVLPGTKIPPGAYTATLK